MTSLVGLYTLGGFRHVKSSNVRQADKSSVNLSVVPETEVPANAIHLGQINNKGMVFFIDPAAVPFFDLAEEGFAHHNDDGDTSVPSNTESPEESIAQDATPTAISQWGEEEPSSFSSPDPEPEQNPKSSGGWSY